MIFLNLTRNIDNDINNYIETFHFYTNHTFTQAFGNSDFQYIVKPTEPVFYFITFIFSKIFFGKAYLYIGFLTFLFYFNFLYGINKLLKKFDQPANKYFISYFIIIFACINFSETSHLLRQYFGGSLMPLFIYYLFNNNNLKIIILALLIILTHNSLLVIILLLVFSKILFSLYNKKKSFSILLAIVFFFYLFFYLLNYLNSLSYFDEPTNIKYISLYYDLIILIFYFIFSLSQINKLPSWNRFFIIFTIFFIIFLSNLIYSETLFLRFYLNIEWFRFFYFYIIILSLEKLNLFKKNKFILYLLFVTVFILRIIVAPWQYFSFELFN